MSLHLLDATTLRDLLKNKKITPQEISDELFKHIKKLDSSIQAWDYLDQSVVNQQLKQIQTYKNESLYGIPIGIKDIFNTQNMPTQMGSPLWKNFTAGNDARVVHYLRESGAVIMGKTSTAEFAVHHQTKTHNPHDYKRSPGTSSSGSAAAVASGMVPIALGTQTAGSIGRPASYCGVYGFKPSFGIIPRIGVLKTSDTLDSIGFFTRSIDDLSLAFEASRAKGENYEYVHKYIDKRSIKKNKYRVAIIEHPFSHLNNANTQEKFTKWLKTLEQNNIKITNLVLLDKFKEIYALHKIIYDKSLSYYFKKEFENKQLISPIMNKIISNGTTIKPEFYHECIKKQAQLTQEMQNYFKDYDILIMPTTADIAPIGLDTLDIPDSNLIWSFLGMPTVSAPLLKGEFNMPQGVLFVAKKYDDQLLLQFLSDLENNEIIKKETNV